MIVVYGASPSVTRTTWNGINVWTTGLQTPWEIVRTYSDTCVMVVSEVEHLKDDMTGMYVINEGGYDVAEEAVLRGAYCFNCKMIEGLWKLRKLISEYK